MKKKKQTLAIGSDHAGFEVKEWLRTNFQDVDWVDVGCNSAVRCDYPDFGRKACELVLERKADGAVLICGSGIGMSIAANRLKGIRAVLAHSEVAARLSRAHNDSNVLCLGARISAPDYIRDILSQWLATPFEGGRHADRIIKLG